MDVENSIEERARDFITDIKELLKQSALEWAGEALRDKHQSLLRGGRRRRERRTEASLTQLTQEVLDFIRENPGLRMEELSRQMSLPSKKLVVPMKRLLEFNQIEGRGNTRATQYFAAALS